MYMHIYMVCVCVCVCAPWRACVIWQQALPAYWGVYCWEMISIYKHSWSETEFSDYSAELQEFKRCWWKFVVCF